MWASPRGKKVGELRTCLNCLPAHHWLGLSLPEPKKEKVEGFGAKDAEIGGRGRYYHRL